MSYSKEESQAVDDEIMRIWNQERNKNLIRFGSLIGIGLLCLALCFVVYGV